jgi:hypothetical protein
MRERRLLELGEPIVFRGVVSLVPRQPLTDGPRRERRANVLGSCPVRHFDAIRSQPVRFLIFV